MYSRYITLGVSPQLFCIPMYYVLALHVKILSKYLTVNSLLIGGGGFLEITLILLQNLLVVSIVLWIYSVIIECCWQVVDSDASQKRG